MKPRKNYRTRPKKCGAKKKQKVSSQKRRLVASGCDEASLKKLNTVEIRNLLKETAKKKSKKTAVKKKTSKPAAVKKKAKTTKTAK